MYIVRCINGKLNMENATTLHCFLSKEVGFYVHFLSTLFFKTKYVFVFFKVQIKTLKTWGLVSYLYF